MKTNGSLRRVVHIRELRRSHLNLAILFGLLGVGGWFPGASVAQTVNATANGSWANAATWSDNAPPSPDKDYVVGTGFQVTSPPVPSAGTYDSTFAGRSLTVLSGGTLALPSNSGSNNAAETLTIPNLVLDADSLLKVSAKSGNISRTLTTGIKLPDAGQVQWALTISTSNSYTNSLTLDSGAHLAGGADIQVSVDALSVGGMDRRAIRIGSANNPFSGNWTVNSTNAVFGSKMGLLVAAAPNALGTGQVTLTHSALRNDAPNGIDSLSAITLNTGSLLELRAAWDSPTTPLTIDASDSAVYIKHAGINAIGNLSGVGGSRIAGFINGASLTTHSTADTTFAGFFDTSGAGSSISLIKDGPATLTLTGTNNMTGGTTIQAGTLRVGNGGTTGTLSGNIVDNASLVFDRANLITYSDAISGTGRLVQAGTNVLLLTGDHTYTGGTLISSPQGTLRVGNGGPTGSIIGDVLNNSVNGGLAFSRSTPLTFSGAISGTGKLGQIGSGMLTLTGQNTYTGQTIVAGGSTLAIGAGGATGQIVSDALVYGTLAFNRSDDVIYGGTISGDGVVSQRGTGRLIFIGDHTYQGGTDIASGTLQIGNGGASGSLLGDVANNGVLAFNRSDNVLFDGTVGGTGVVQQLGSGMVTLTADHNYTGATTIASGALRLGDGGLGGSVAGDVADNGVLIFDRAQNLSYGGVVSGTGNVVKQGTNMLTLTGDSSYAGTTTVASGTLSVTGRIASSATQVDSGARLQGTGRVDSNVTVADNGQLAPGASVGTLTIGGSLLLNPASQLDYELGNPLSANDRIDVGSHLTLDGVLNISDAGGFSTGVYRIFNYGGTLTNNGLGFGILPFGVSPANIQVQTNIPNQVNLIVVTPSGFGLQFWDGARTTGNGVIEGGDGVWNNVDTHWSSADGTVNAAWGNGFAVFQGAAGTVTVADDVTSTGMQFITDGYHVISGGGRVLAEPALQIRVDGTATATVDAPIADGAGGAAVLTKTGAGTLVLGGVNTYSGGTVVDGGVLSLQADAALGASGSDVTLANGTLQTTASFESSRPLVLGGAGGTLTPMAGTTLTWTGQISGAGNLHKSGLGTLALAGSNSFVGDVVMSGGVVEVGADSGFGNAGNGLYLDGGTLRWSNSFDVATSHELLLGPMGGQFDTHGHTSTLAQAIEGVGGLTKAGDGTLILVGSNTYTGGTTVAGGTLQVGAGGTTGRVLGDIIDNGVLVANRSDAITFYGVVSGTGRFEQRGPGVLTVTGDNTYTGGTLISAGTLQLGDGGTIGSVVGNIVNNSELIFDHSNSQWFEGQISGTGHVTKRDTNTLTWTGDQTYTGGTLIEDGTLMIGNGGTTGSLQGDVVNGGTLVFDRSNDATYGGSVSGTGALVKQGAGALHLDGVSTFTGGTTIEAGVLSIASDAALGDPVSPLTFNGGDLQLRASFSSTRALQLNVDGAIDTMANRNKFSGPIFGPGGLTKQGTGELILNGVDEYRGVTHVQAGTLAIGDSTHPEAVLLSGGGINVDAAAMFGGYGNVVGDVRNAGTLGVGNALPAFASEPDAQFAIIGRLINSGLVTMVNGSPADTLSLSGDPAVVQLHGFSIPAGAYVSNNGRLAMEAVLNEGGVNTQADRLNAESVEVAGGPTRLTVKSVGGDGALTVGDGILLVNVANAAASAAGAFVLDGRVVAGPYEYQLFQGGQEAGNGNWYLRSLAEPKPEPILRPEVGSYLAAGDAARQMFLQTLHERMLEPDTLVPAERPAWLRMQGYGVRGTADDGLLKSEGSDFLLQGGLDLVNAETDSGLVRAGMMAGYGHASLDSVADFNSATSRASVVGYTVGAYGTWFADANSGKGFYSDSWLQYAWFDHRVTATELAPVDYGTHLGQVSLELGYTLPIGAQLRLQPQVQAIYTWQNDKRLVDTVDTQIALKGESDVVGRVGLHVFRDVGPVGRLRPFADVNVWFGGTPTHAAFNDTTIRNDLRHTVYEVALGLQGVIVERWTLSARLGQQWDSGSYRRTAGQFNVKWNW